MSHCVACISCYEHAFHIIGGNSILASKLGMKIYGEEL